MAKIWKVLTAPIVFLFYCTSINSKFHTFSDIDFMLNSNNSILLVAEKNDIFFKEYKYDIIKALAKKGFNICLHEKKASAPIDIIATFNLECSSQDYTYQTNIYDYVPNGNSITTISSDYQITTVKEKELAVVGVSTNHATNRIHSFLLTFYNADPDNPEMVFSLYVETAYASNRSIGNKFMHKFLIKEGISRINPLKSEEYNFKIRFPLGIDERQY